MKSKKAYLQQPLPKWLPPQTQLQLLLRDYPGSYYNITPSGIYNWFWVCKPTPFSISYTIRIEFGAGRVPRVQVLSPKPLPKAPGAKYYEHINHPQERQYLCLHLPREWKGHMIIADTFVPWTSEWLYSYEVWVETGEWTGEGHRRETHN